jgi:outer membrane protein assembly factor BamA
MRARASLFLIWLLGTAPALLPAPNAHAATRIDVTGGAVPRRQLEGWLTEAIHAPGDSVALARALGEVCSRLQDSGYLDARAEGRWQSLAGDWDLVAQVREGMRYRITRLDFDVLAGDSSGIAAALPVHVGDWASPGAIAAAADSAVGRLAQTGYPYAQITMTSFDWDSAGARLRMSGAGGPRVTITGVDIQGLHATRPRFAARTLNGAIGKPYDPAAAEAGRDRLLQLGLFRQVSWQGLAGEPNWKNARLQYQVEELHYNQFEGVIGSRPGGGTSGLLRLELGNLAGTGRVLGARWEGRGPASELISAHYVEPQLLGAPLHLEFFVEQERQDTLFTRERLGGGLQFLISAHDRLETGLEESHVLDPRAGVTEADLQTTTFALERDTRDGPFVPRRGSRARLSASQSFKRELLAAGGQDKARASAIEGLVELYRPIRPHLGLAWQLQGAGRFSSQDVLSEFERYPLGGAATLRGFDEQAFRVDRYGLSRAESRWFPGRTGQHVALFWDHAWTSTRVPTDTGTREDVAQHDSFGFGLRFEGPSGLIRVDYGLEAGRSPSEGKLHLQLMSSF